MTLFSRFEVLEDPRDPRGKKYKLIDILIMTIYGLLFGLKDFVNIADYMKLNEEYFTELLGLENGTPSHDCLSDLFARIDSKKFMNIFIKWTEELLKSKNGKNISIDGKAIKSATDKVNNGNIPYIVSAFIGEIGLSIGQVKVDDKSNEITAIPDLLDLIDIEGATITIDAIGTQFEIAKKIVFNGGHYVLKVKKNQAELLKQIKSQFNSYNNLYGNSEVLYKKTIEKDHGRGEIREYFLTYNTSKIKDKEKWVTVKAIAYIKVITETNEEVKETDNYYIIDHEIDVEKLEKVIRDHWNIECGLHWRLDVILDEDHSRNRKENSIQNLATLRKIVVSGVVNKKTNFKPQIADMMAHVDFSNLEEYSNDIVSIGLNESKDLGECLDKLERELLLNFGEFKLTRPQDNFTNNFIKQLERIRKMEHEEKIREIVVLIDSYTFPDERSKSLFESFVDDYVFSKEGASERIIDLSYALTVLKYYNYDLIKQDDIGFAK